MSDKTPRGYSLAADLKATYLSHVKVPETVRGPLDGNAIVEAAAASFDPQARHAAALAYAGVKSIAAPAVVSREEKVERMKAWLLQNYSDNLDEVPSLAWVDGLTGPQYEVVLDALAELNPPEPLDPDDDFYDNEGFVYDGFDSDEVTY